MHNPSFLTTSIMFILFKEFMECPTISTQACFPSINPLGIAFGVKISYLKSRMHWINYIVIYENKKC